MKPSESKQPPIDEYPEDSEEPKFGSADIPEPKMIDVMRELKSTQNMLNEFLDEVKKLGFEMVTENASAQTALKDLALKMGDLQSAFIRTVQAPAPKIQQATKSQPMQQGQFDPADLIQHSWKGKKIGDRQYAQGSLTFGWDFATEFKPETIQELIIQGTIQIDQYEISLTENKKLVRTKKMKQ